VRIGPTAATALLVVAGAALTFLPPRHLHGAPATADGARARIGLVFDVGGRGDKSFNDAAYAGLERAKQQLGVPYSTIEMGEGNDREAALRQLAAGGSQLVIGVGFLFTDDIKSLAREFPNVKFACVDYTVSPGDPYPAEPYDDQEGDIVQGMQRLQAFTQSTGIPHSQIMVFPFNISPPETLTLLKKYNFQATINSLDYPLTTTRVRNVDSYMYPSEMSYNNFAVIKRFSPATSPYVFDLFLDRPTFLYSHNDFFDNGGITALDPIADRINASDGNVEWKSLDYILKHMYLERLNDDGTWDAKFYGNDIIVTNETAGDLVYHIRRDETLNVPIFAVTLDGVAVNYSVNNGQLQVDAVVPSLSTRELKIVYGSGP
jgi:hypothetical protein